MSYADQPPSHFPVEYLSWRHMKTSGDYQVVLGFPAEAFHLFMSVIGEPPKAGESKWLAIAPLEHPNG